MNILDNILRGQNSHKKFPRHPQKLLIRSTNWIGDAIMTTPAVRTIRKSYPEAEITLLALPWVSDVFAASSRVDRIFHYEKNGRHKGLKGKWKLASELRAKQFDAVILLQNAFEAALITTLAGIPARGGYTTDGRGLLLTHGIKKDPEIGLKHQVHYYQDMLAGLELTPGSDQLELFLDPHAVDFILSELNNIKKKVGNFPVVGLNPGAAYGPAKRWPAEKYGELAKRLCTQPGAIVLVFGTESDREAAAAIKVAASSDERVVDLTGKTNLATAMAYIGQCDAFVTNDSGLMHVAAALQTPTVAIFGSTNHIATGPYSKNAQVLRKPMECSPCMKTHCHKNNFLCMEQIQPDEVFSAVKAILN
jgi:heptosyltransferase-2